MAFFTSQHVKVNNKCPKKNENNFCLVKSTSRIRHETSAPAPAQKSSAPPSPIVRTLLVESGLAALPDDPGAGLLVLIEPDLLLPPLEERVVVVDILHQDGDAGRGLLPHPRVGHVQGRHGQRVPAQTPTYFTGIYKNIRYLVPNLQL